ncbi:Proteasome subunit alpha type [Plasmodiophora brassicae]|uniref:Proteasome subunit alpha type n=1 Tax=Plasmodiophora brassicae TaxID=37360 RepID=A0A0G4IW04_PLABS|nr:hypothetical protein PBRA_007256 [Plasmodiophora brassicae]SPQ95980.1 unnamed protein product [Plasmodiophora brassicae]
MYRNQYDDSVTTYSPVGRLHQVEYAMEAVKQGSAVCGLRSKTTAVLAAFRRTSSDLGSPQQKLFRIDAHMGIGVSGLIADARGLSVYMRGEALNHQYLYGSNIPIVRIASKVSDKSQVYTQKATKRPYGVGLLVVGVDRTGAHLFETSPCGLHYEYVAQALGARSQSAKTYLEKYYESFDDASDDDLILHAIKSLRGSSPTGEITADNVEIGIVSTTRPFTVLEREELERYITRANADGQGGPRPSSTDAMQED